MALSEKRFNHIFRNRRGKIMGDYFMENISVTVDHVEREVVVEVLKDRRMIVIEYIDGDDENPFELLIRFHRIEETSYPSVDTVKLKLVTGQEVLFRFPSENSKNDFIDAITLVSDSGNSE